MNQEGIENWLIQKISEELDIPEEEIDPETPFANYGMDSALAVALSGELEELLHKKTEPTIIFDYPTIESLAAFLADKNAI